MEAIECTTMAWGAFAAGLIMATILCVILFGFTLKLWSFLDKGQEV